MSYKPTNKFRLMATHSKGERRSMSKYQYGQVASGSRSYDTRNKVQILTSEGHPFRLLGKRDDLDIGGPFETRSLELDLERWQPETSRYFYNTTLKQWQEELTTIPAPSTDFVSLDNKVQFGGGFPDYSSTAAWLTPRTPQGYTANQLDALGAIAIDGCKPTNPVADLAVSIGEFVSERKFFSVPGTAGSLPGEYLNYMFGIAPTLADIQDLRTAMTEKEELLKQYRRDSGRLVRRRWEPEGDVKASVTKTQGVQCWTIGPGYSSYTCPPSGTLTKFTSTYTRWWFSGAFTYYLPKEGTWGRTVAELDYLYGIKPGYALAWELMPYSWLIDYRSSIGSVMSNIDSFIQDGLVMPYAYIMATHVVDEEHVWEGAIRDPDGILVPRRIRGRKISTLKQRRPATPFGFGIPPGGLSARQLSIIAALGLTKLDK